ncbi:MAG: hypothetical protein ACO3A2_02450 [Bdellovibrionia bacterium]
MRERRKSDLGWVFGPSPTTMRGQALLEFAGVVGILFGILSLVFYLMFEHARRARCAYLAFENTHLARQQQGAGRTFFSSAPRSAGDSFRVIPQEEGVFGVQSCGHWRISVQMMDLEHAQW